MWDFWKKTLIVCETLAIDSSNEISSNNQTSSDFLHAIESEGRDDSAFMVVDDRLIFPNGIIENAVGGTPGTREDRSLPISEQELIEIIFLLEEYAISANEVDGAADMTETESFFDWDNGFGIVNFLIKTANGSENNLNMFFNSEDIVHGSGGNVKDSSMGLNFHIQSKELADSLRKLVGFRIIDLHELDQSNSARLTSIVDESKITLTGDDLFLLIDGIQAGEKLPSGTRYDANGSFIEFIKKDSSIVNAVLSPSSSRTGYIIVAVESEVYDVKKDSIISVLRFMEEKGFPIFDLD